MDKLMRHIQGLAKESERLIKDIPIPEGVTDEQKAVLLGARNAFNFKGDLKEKQQELNNLLNAVTNNR